MGAPPDAVPACPLCEEHLPRLWKSGGAACDPERTTRPCARFRGAVPRAAQAVYPVHCCVNVASIALKLIPSWFVGGRDSDAAIIFMDDLRSRLANRVQLTSDGHKAVEGAFGGDVDYAMLVKLYDPHRNSPRAATTPLNASVPVRKRLRAIPIRRTSARPMPSGRI